MASASLLPSQIWAITASSETAKSATGAAVAWLPAEGTANPGSRIVTEEFTRPLCWICDREGVFQPEHFPAGVMVSRFWRSIFATLHRTATWHTSLHT